MCGITSPFRGSDRGQIPGRILEVFPIPNKPSALKRVRQSQKRRFRNLRRKKQMRQLIKQINEQVNAGQAKDAQALLPALMKAVDKAAQRSAIHRNKAARIKSRLTKRVKQAS